MEFVSCRILAYVYSGILFGLGLPLANMVSLEWTMFSQSCWCFYFRVSLCYPNQIYIVLCIMAELLSW